MNWINPKLIRNSLGREFEIKLTKVASTKYFSRFNKEGEFTERKGPIVKMLAKLAKQVFYILPVDINPVIDCKITRRKIQSD